LGENLVGRLGECESRKDQKKGQNRRELHVFIYVGFGDLVVIETTFD
jgi:hypothetical protein